MIALKMKEILYANRVIWVNDKLYIEDYKNLIELEEERILTFDFEILGNKLHVKEMDKQLIVITGEINGIRRRTKDEHL